MKRIFAALLLVAMLAACLSGCGSDKGGEKPAPVTTLGGSGETRPAVTQPADNKPAATWPVASQPAQTQPAAVQPSKEDGIVGTWAYELEDSPAAYFNGLQTLSYFNDDTVTIEVCFVFDSNGTASTYLDVDIEPWLRATLNKMVQQNAEESGSTYEAVMQELIGEYGSEEAVFAGFLNDICDVDSIDELMEGQPTKNAPEKGTYTYSNGRLTTSYEGETEELDVQINGDTMTISGEGVSLVFHRK